MYAELELQTFFIEDRIQQWGPQCKYLATSQSLSQGSGHYGGNKLIVIKYVGTPFTSPSFKDTGAEHTFSLEFNTLDIVVNRGTIVALLSLLETVNEVMAKSSKSSSDEAPPPVGVDTLGDSTEHELDESDEHLLLGASSSSSSAPVAAEVPNAPKPEDDGLDDEIKRVPSHRLLAVSILVRRVSVTLARNGAHFVVAALQDTSITAGIENNNEIEASGSLGNFGISDCTAGTKWPEIVKCVGERVLDFDFRMRNPEKSMAERFEAVGFNDGGSMEIRLQIEAVRAVFVNRFVDSLLKYLNELTEMQQLIQSAGKKAAVSTKEQVQQTSKQLRFNVTINNPHVIVPISADSDEHLTAYLGSVHVSNELLLDDVALLDRITLKIADLGAKSVQPLLPTPTQTLIADSTLTLGVTRPLASKAMHTLPALAVIGNFSDINLIVSESQLEAIFNLLAGNLLEQAPTEQSLDVLQAKRFVSRGRMKSHARSVEPAGSPSLSSSNESDLSSVIPPGASEDDKKPEHVITQIVAKVTMARVSLILARGIGIAADGTPLQVVSFAIQDQEIDFSMVRSNKTKRARSLARSY